MLECCANLNVYMSCLHFLREKQAEIESLRREGAQMQSELLKMKEKGALVQKQLK